MFTFSRIKKFISNRTRTGRKNKKRLMGRLVMMEENFARLKNSGSVLSGEKKIIP